MTGWCIDLMASFMKWTLKCYLFLQLEAYSVLCFDFCKHFKDHQKSWSNLWTKAVKFWPDLIPSFRREVSWGKLCCCSPPSLFLPASLLFPLFSLSVQLENKIGNEEMILTNATFQKMNKAQFHFILFIKSHRHCIRIGWGHS